jgi:molecular chaperone GrpE
MSEHVGDEPEDEQVSGAGEDDEVIFPEQDDGEAEAEPSELEKAQAERDRMRDQLLRIAADFDNFRKRSRKEIEAVRQRTIEDTLREVLPIVDNLERAADSMTGASASNGFPPSGISSTRPATTPCSKKRPTSMRRAPS